MIDIGDFVASWRSTSFAHHGLKPYHRLRPWQVTSRAVELIHAMFRGSKVAHLSFVGDSMIGAGVNIEAGAIVANYRNEMDDKRIRIAWRGGIIDTGVEKFGALIGDHARIGQMPSSHRGH